MSEIIIADQIQVKRGIRVLQTPISFTWRKGEVWCVTGSTGSGKTTLLKMLAGLLYPSEGSLIYPIWEEIKKNGQHVPFISDLIAFVPQEIAIPTGDYIADMYYQRRFQATQQEDIPCVREILLNQCRRDEALVTSVLKQMGLTEMADQAFVQLSNGQTRRLMFAIALVKKPTILILDNPYTGLDQQARMDINEKLKNLANHEINLFIAAHEHELELMDFVNQVIQLNPVMPPHLSNTQMPEKYSLPLRFSNTEVLRMHHIRIAYGEKVILKLDEWQVKPLERWVIQGKNGSGKSTLLSVIMADHPQAYANEVYLFGNKRGSGESIWDIKKRIGYFSPELLRFFELNHSVDEVIASGWSDYIGNVPPLNEERSIQVTELVQWLGIEELQNLTLGDLSLGQQKMVLIARAMFRNPELLILDEPLQGMDIKWREQFKQKIDEFSRNRTILYVTHDKDEIPGGSWKYLNL